MIVVDTAQGNLQMGVMSFLVGATLLSAVCSNRHYRHNNIITGGHDDSTVDIQCWGRAQHPRPFTSY